jgi:hypothetical protein
MSIFGCTRKPLKPFIFLCLTVAGASIASRPATAACHVVSPSGSGSRTGADWNNALAGLPATLVRGDSYYLSDGAYPAYSFSTANSGSTLITIKKAIASDHCTDTGWSTATMGSAQAIFSNSTGLGFAFTSSGAGNVTVTGNGASQAAGCGGGNGNAASDCGIKLDGSGCTGSSCWNIPVGAPGGVVNLTLQYIEIVGSGSNSTANTSHPNENIRFNGTTNANALIQHVYIHDSSCVPIVMFQNSGTTSGITVDHSVFWKNYDLAAGCHAQGIQMQDGVSNITVSNNAFYDIAGNGEIDCLQAVANPPVCDTIKVYGNTFAMCPSNCNNQQSPVNGLISCLNGAQCTNWTFVQNTIINRTLSNSAPMMNINGSTGSGVVENNLWYSSNTPAFALPSGWTEDYNTYLNTPAPTFSGGGQSGQGAHDIVVASSAPNPFMGWPANTPWNDDLVASLTSENSDWTAGLTLSSPYNQAPNGIIRGVDGSWDRGAYQYASGGPPPAAPTGLTAVVK